MLPLLPRSILVPFELFLAPSKIALIYTLRKESTSIKLAFKMESLVLRFSLVKFLILLKKVFFLIELIIVFSNSVKISLTVASTSML